MLNVRGSVPLPVARPHYLETHTPATPQFDLSRLSWSWCSHSLLPSTRTMSATGYVVTTAAAPPSWVRGRGGTTSRPAPRRTQSIISCGRLSDYPGYSLEWSGVTSKWARPLLSMRSCWMFSAQARHSTAIITPSIINNNHHFTVIIIQGQHRT